MAPIVAAALVVVGTPLAALGATAIPVVRSFTASRTSVPDSGARITLTARLEYASTCKLTVTPRITGFPRSFSCSSNTVSQSVLFPSNRGQNPINYSFGLLVTNHAGTTRATNVAVTEGAQPPPITFTTPSPGTPTSLVFADEGVFVADEPLIVTATNNSATTQIITQIGVGNLGDPNDFILNQNNCNYITAHANCSFAVQFQPRGAGARTGVLDLFDASWGNSGTTAVLHLQGTGVWATATLANADITGTGTSSILNFPGSQGVLTTSSIQYITLSNAGSVPLYISGIGVFGGETSDFRTTPGNCYNQITGGYPLIVSVGQSCTLGVNFEPSGSGTRSSYLVIDDNTLGTQTQLQIQGTGEYSSDTLSVNGDTAEPSPISFDFGATPASGPGVHATLTITNTSAVTLTFNGYSSSGVNSSNFNISVSNACVSQGAQLASGQSCSVQLNFGPQGTQGTLQASLFIGDNSVDGGETITVTGTGS